MSKSQHPVMRSSNYAARRSARAPVTGHVDDPSALCPDRAIEHLDGTLELNGYFFEVDWDEIDPPEGHPDAQEIPHETVVAEIRAFLGAPDDSK